MNNKCIEHQFRFTVVPGSGPALLGMLHCESAQLLSISCQTTTDEQKDRQISIKTREEKLKTNNNIKNNPHMSKFKQEMD